MKNVAKEKMRKFLNYLTEGIPLENLPVLKTACLSHTQRLLERVNMWVDDRLIEMEFDEWLKERVEAEEYKKGCFNPMDKEVEA